MTEPREESAKLRLRLRQTLEHHGKVVQRLMQPIVEALDGTDKIVLIVEDDEPTRRGYVRLLREHCKQIIPCGSVEEALQAIENHDRIDVVVLDVYLPDGSGIDVAAHFRQKFPNAKGVVISGYLSEPIKKLILRTGGEWAFREKPTEEVMAAILAAIAS